MNTSDYILLNILLDHPTASQRELAKISTFSLGKVNRSLQRLRASGFLDSLGYPTTEAPQKLSLFRPQRAIILAAGYGLRMIPLNIDTPKGLLKVESETLIERLITQLRAAGIFEIYVVVGHLKEKYEFLTDSYDVKLLVNENFASKNNLHSLYRAMPYLDNAYVLPCDIWCRENPFSQREFYSWYGVSERKIKGSPVKLTRDRRLIPCKTAESGNEMIGIAYISGEDAPRFQALLEAHAHSSAYDHSFWEVLLSGTDGYLFPGKPFSSEEIFEFNTTDDYKRFASKTSLLENQTLQLLASLLGVSPGDITNIQPLKSGMTNRSFTFDVKEKGYIMRIPGEGTQFLINRHQEKAVHDVLIPAGLADELLYFDPERGYKLTQRLPHPRTCESRNIEDVTRCIRALRDFHRLNLKVPHTFDLFSEIEYFETLRGQIPSVYKDYPRTKAHVYKLKDFIQDHVTETTLCHIDAVPDNFLFYREESAQKESLKLIDWEYAGMQDPHIDLAMFSVYANYTSEEVDRLISLYFEENIPENVHMKIYAYIAACGFLWSNWCEYKRLLGVDFGEYSLNQYRFAKEYYKKVVASDAYRAWLKSKEEATASS